MGTGSERWMAPAWPLFHNYTNLMDIYLVIISFRIPIVSQYRQPNRHHAFPKTAVPSRRKGAPPSFPYSNRRRKSHDKFPDAPPEQNSDVTGAGQPGPGGKYGMKHDRERAPAKQKDQGLIMLVGEPAAQNDTRYAGRATQRDQEYPCIDARRRPGPEGAPVHPFFQSPSAETRPGDFCGHVLPKTHDDRIIAYYSWNSGDLSP